jgi:hypothetical protein
MFLDYRGTPNKADIYDLAYANAIAQRFVPISRPSADNQTVFVKNSTE